MRISTNQFYFRGLNNMLKQQGEVAKYQKQLSSGKKIETASDDPIAAAKISLMQQRIASAKQWQENKNGAESVVNTEERILGNIQSIIHRVRELQIQAGNSALSDADRQATAIELRILRDQLFDLANSSDNGGNYLFSGSKTFTQPFSVNASNQYVYNGDDTQRLQKISNMMSVALSDSGADLFMRLPNGNGSFSIQQTSTPNTGTAVADSGAVVNSSAFVADNYTVQFVLNSSNQLVYMISGASAGNIDPATGNPDDATVYQDGTMIGFNGIQFKVSGTPNPGDAFLIKPAVNESLFSTMNRMINNLQNPLSNPTARATFQTENNQILEQLDTAMNNLLGFQAQTGTRLNQLQLVEEINQDLIDTSTASLSILQDADINSAAVQLNLQIIYLQAAQQSFVKVQNLSAFNYM